MKVRLNGWQRIWIVLSTLYLLLVVGVTIAVWPTPETTYHRDEFVVRMPVELREKVEGAYASSYQRDEARRKRVPSIDELEREYQASLQKGSKSKKVSPPYPAGFIPDPLEFPNGAVIDVHSAVMKTDMDRVAAAYWAVVESATRAERWRRAWQMALVWLIPSLALYVLGWAVAWVRRGFAKA